MATRKAYVKKTEIKKRKPRPLTDLSAKTLTIISLNDKGQQQVVSSYNWNNSSDYHFIIKNVNTLKKELINELKAFDANLANWVKKGRTKRIARLTTSNGTYFL